MGVIEDLSDYPRVMARLAELLKAGRPRLPRLRRGQGAGRHLQLRHQVRLARHVPHGLHAGAAGRRSTSSPHPAGRRLERPPQLPPLGEERPRALGREPGRGGPRSRDEKTWRLFRLLFAGTAGSMNDPTYELTAYRMVLELPADRRTSESHAPALARPAALARRYRVLTLARRGRRLRRLRRCAAAPRRPRRGGARGWRRATPRGRGAPKGTTAGWRRPADRPPRSPPTSRRSSSTRSRSRRTRSSAGALVPGRVRDRRGEPRRRRIYERGRQVERAGARPAGDAASAAAGASTRCRRRRSARALAGAAWAAQIYLGTAGHWGLWAQASGAVRRRAPGRARQGARLHAGEPRPRPALHDGAACRLLGRLYTRDAAACRC